MINLILDFDGVINNEPVATINAFRSVFKKINCERLPEEAFIMLKYFDETQGYLDYDEIIKKTFSQFTNKPNYCLTLFKRTLKLKPRWDLIKVLDEYKNALRVIIFSRNNYNTINDFLIKNNIKTYFNKIYANQEKFKISSFNELRKSEELQPSNTLFVGDEIYDVYFPRLFNFKYVLFNPLFSNKPISELVLGVLNKDFHNEITK